MIIIDDQVLRGALAAIQAAPRALAKATHEARRAEGMLKHFKALEMKRHNEKSAAVQEREAYASEAYKQALEADARAAANLALQRAEFDAAKMVIELYRTQSATERASYG